MKVSYLDRGAKPRLAYVYSPPAPGNTAPLVMFCGGYRSDMNGTKATDLEVRCRARGQGYLRFDYGGHGLSSGTFEEGTIGAWAEDALDILDAVHPNGPVLPVGSSMGGWMVLLLALKRPERMAGLIGIAAAPDFTDDLFENRLDAQQKQVLFEKGVVHVENDYSDEPYVFTRTFYEDAKHQRVLTQSHQFDFPVVLIQGKKDLDVHWRTAEAIKAHLTGAVEIIYVEDGDHRLSRPQDLELIDTEVLKLSKL